MVSQNQLKFESLGVREKVHLDQALELLVLDD